jgi:hypothetical protein
MTLPEFNSVKRAEPKLIHPIIYFWQSSLAVTGRK